MYAPLEVKVMCEWLCYYHINLQPIICKFVASWHPICGSHVKLGWLQVKLLVAAHPVLPLPLSKEGAPPNWTNMQVHKASTPPPDKMRQRHKRPAKAINLGKHWHLPYLLLERFIKKVVQWVMRHFANTHTNEHKNISLIFPWVCNSSHLIVCTG